MLETEAVVDASARQRWPWLTRGEQQTRSRQLKELGHPKHYVFSLSEKKKQFLDESIWKTV